MDETHKCRVNLFVSTGPVGLRGPMAQRRAPKSGGLGLDPHLSKTSWGKRAIEPLKPQVMGALSSHGYLAWREGSPKPYPATSPGRYSGPRITEAFWSKTLKHVFKRYDQAPKVNNNSFQHKDTPYCTHHRPPEAHCHQVSSTTMVIAENMATTSAGPHGLSYVPLGRTIAVQC